MSNLRKTLRAMNQSEEWRDMVEAAALITGAEFTPDLLVQVTHTLADQISMDEDTLEIDVSGVDEEELMGAVAEFAPETRPDVLTVLADLTARVEALEPTPAWSPEGVAYTAGDLVTYDGATYTCVQPHTSQAGWIPSGLPALWKPITDVEGVGRG